MKNIILTIMLLLVPFMASAQSRDKLLTIHAVNATGDNLEGQQVMVMHNEYQITYGTLKLDATGTCSVKVYEGSHSISIQRAGYEVASADVMVDKDVEVTLTLTEKVRKPFALHSQLLHDAVSGNNSVRLSWNQEEPVFADDFESHQPFAINFEPWTGIDADRETAAALIGDYPNRGVMQYAQIINPLKVEPTWWYEYEVLRPYSGKQYVGFTRTMSGNANDDWLISPALTLGTENMLTFMAKASDKYPERFQVYLTTVIDNPQPSDFQQINTGNYESVDYTKWHEMAYDLSSYSGQTVRLAIRYLGDYNHNGSFMLMVDDFCVGQRSDLAAKNPNESFVLYLDGVEVATTQETNYVIENVTAGSHSIGIKAKYIAAETELVKTEIEINTDDYAYVTLVATTDSKLSPAGTSVVVLNTATAESITSAFDAENKVDLCALPKGEYLITVAEGAYMPFSETITINGDLQVNMVLKDNIINPYNITVTTVDNGDGTINATARWNQELSFTDSFEDYDDFATGSFGGWLSLDLDQMPVYPIGLGSTSNIVRFPGSGTATNPAPIAPIVFNPWNTIPAMLPTDEAIAAPTGNKSIVFFSPQRAFADKWLISPAIDIRDGYVVQFTAKAYSIYPESMEICVSTEGTDTKSFKVLSVIDELSSGTWMRYSTDLSEYAGKTVNIAIHYTSYDAFMAQLDDIMIGSDDGETQTLDYGNVVRYDVFLDHQPYSETTDAGITFTSLSAGEHVLGVQAIYQGGASEVTEYTFGSSTGIDSIILDNVTSSAAYNLSGQKVNTSEMPAGIYIRGGKKYIKK